MQDDSEAVRRKYRPIVQLMMILIAPIMGVLAGLSPALFAQVFYERWAPAVPYLQLLCVDGTLHPLSALNINLLNVKGRSDLVLKVGLMKQAANLILLFLALIPNTYFSARLVGYSLSGQVKGVFKPLFAAFVAGLVSCFFVGLGEGSSFLGLICAGLVGAASYLVVSSVVRAEGASMLFTKAKGLKGRNLRSKVYK